MTNLPSGLTDVLEWLDERDALLRTRCQGLERLLLLEVVREADMVGYARAFDPNRRVPGAPNHLELVWMGLAHAVDLLAPAGMAGPGMAWQPAAPERSAWAMAFLRRSALVSHLRRLAQLVRYDLSSVEILGAKSLRFHIHGEDIEAQDRDAMRWLSRRLQARDAPLLKAFHLEYGNALAAELSNRVSADPQFGIRYSSSRELEECFEFEAGLRAATLAGNDCLPLGARIGPLTFGDYRSVVVAGMARSFKHAAFLQTLLARDPATPGTALTIFADEYKLKDEWGGLLGLDDATAAILLDVIGLAPADLPELRRARDCPQALLIRAGDQFWHTPVYAGLNNPFGWVTAKLRRTFRSDWDKAVNEREACFRDDLRILYPEPRFWFAPTALKIRDAKSVRTDIDALVIDRLCGTMGVFQLKWQDTFESSLAERESRRRNLMKEGNAWIETVADFCRGLEPAEAAVRLGVPRSEAVGVRANRLFILTRNGARFSGPDHQDRRGAWLSWYELLRRCEGARQEEDPLSRIWIGVRRRPKPKADEHVSTFEIDGIHVESIQTFDGL